MEIAATELRTTVANARGDWERRKDDGPEAAGGAGKRERQGGAEGDAARERTFLRGGREAYSKTSLNSALGGSGPSELEMVSNGRETQHKSTKRGFQYKV